MKDIYSIGEVVKKLDINKETVRYYEKVGLLSEPVRDKNGYRIYSKEDIEIIKFILIVKKFGFSLKEIRTLIHDEILCGDIKSIKGIVKNKINELDETKKLLEKLSENILEQNIECCDDIETFLKNIP